jgi:hypothetical protein
MQTGQDEPQRHVVVFDCNIYLDVACIVGPPFSWDKFNKVAASLTKVALPHPKDRGYDSLRAIAVCTTGRFAGDETLEVWTNASIDKIVRGKAAQSPIPDDSGYRGLGWNSEHADSLVDDLIWELAILSHGGTLGSHYPDGNPPLDYEDGMVYGGCRKLASEDPLSRVYCVTRDRGFLQDGRDGRLSSHSTVLTPSAFVALIRAARAQYSTKQMKPSNGF